MNVLEQLTKNDKNFLLQEWNPEKNQWISLNDAVEKIKKSNLKQEKYFS